MKLVDSLAYIMHAPSSRAITQKLFSALDFSTVQHEVPARKSGRGGNLCKEVTLRLRSKVQALISLVDIASHLQTEHLDSILISQSTVLVKSCFNIYQGEVELFVLFKYSDVYLDMGCAGLGLS